MTWQRDLAWQNIEQTYRSSVAHQFARYALSLDYKVLPPDVVHQAKRSLVDTLGCAIGAYEAPGRPICEAVVRGLGGSEEATVIGSGLHTSAPNATLVNSFLVRYLDFNDLGGVGGAGHNSDSISAILAVAERDKANGRDYLTSVVISYELGARFAESTGVGSTGVRIHSGFTGESRGGLTMPPALGKLMGLNEEQIANAIGVCACHELPLAVLDTDREENTMSKNLRLGWISYNAVLACLLAKNGFTGPVRVVEGENGINQALFRGGLDFQRLLDFSGWRILKVGFKALPADGSSQGHLLATLAIVKEHDLKPGDIAAVRITTSVYESRHCTIPAKKYPRNAESADHSVFWTNAMVIRDRDLTPDSYKPENYTDPVILDLIEKITVEADPNTPGLWWGRSEITTKDGRVFQKRVDTIHGLGGDPLTDTEVEEKFRKMAIKYMSERQMKQIIDTVWNLEKLDDMGKLMKLMVFQPR